MMMMKYLLDPFDHVASKPEYIVIHFFFFFLLEMRFEAHFTFRGKAEGPLEG